jgi:nitrite reductase (NADH) large subunit
MIQSRRLTLVVVGTGMAGAKLVEEVLTRDPTRFAVRMFGAEPHGTYNRVLLSGVLGGFHDPERLWLNPLEWYDKHGVFVHAGVKADAIDRGRRVVLGAGGKVVEPYDLLVLATGSRPWVPPLEGADKPGVFVFRTLEDCAAIAGRARDSRRAVVLGGGLLGLEAARGLVALGVGVTVVEAAGHLMPQQLDPAGGALLRAQIEGLGIECRCGARAAEVLGAEGVTGVRLHDGTTREADLVVLSCGIRPNVEEARAAGLAVERAIVVDDRLRTSDPDVFAVGECAQHRGTVYGLVEPLYEQARVLADVLTGSDPESAYTGSRVATTLKVMCVELTTMGDARAAADGEVVSHLDPAAGVYKKLVVRDNRLTGAILLGTGDPGHALRRLFLTDAELPVGALELLSGNGLAAGADEADLLALPDDTPVCNCHGVCKGALVTAIADRARSVEALGEKTKAGTGCGSCRPLLARLLEQCAPTSPAHPRAVNKIEAMKRQKDGLDALPDVLKLAGGNRWGEMSEDDKQRAKWHGLFFRKQTPGHFMLRLRLDGGRTDARQLRTIAELCEEYGKGFCDLTTRQQVQLRWFTLADVEDIWRRLEAVGLHSKQTGMDNVRGVVGCPLAGRTPHELFDATPVVRAFAGMLLGNKEFTNLPRKFNVTITGCLENCCHAETQDLALVPAYRELDGARVNGFNMLAGGKQGSGGYVPARPVDVFVPPQEAAALCAAVTLLFRDHGPRASRTRARLAFLLEDRGVAWFRKELSRRLGRPLHRAGADLRKAHHSDHLGFHPQKRSAHDTGPALFSVGLLVPVGRITAAQLRGVADLAEFYGSGEVRLSVQQNLVLTDVPEHRIGALADEPLLKELSFDPSPVLRGLVSCTGNDYCHMALIDTKGWAVAVARELEKRTAGHKVAPLTIHWSGCSAGCGLHQTATIGLQAVRARVRGAVVDAAHVSVLGRTGPDARVAADLMYDVPCDQLADALAPLVKHLPRK